MVFLGLIPRCFLSDKFFLLIIGQVVLFLYSSSVFSPAPPKFVAGFVLFNPMFSFDFSQLLFLHLLFFLFTAFAQFFKFAV